MWSFDYHSPLSVAKEVGIVWPFQPSVGTTHLTFISPLFHLFSSQHLPPYLSLSQLSNKITFIYHPISKSILEHSVKPPQEAKSIPLTELHLKKRTASIPTIKLSLALLPTSPNHISHITYEPPPTHPRRLPGPNPQHLNHPQPTTSSGGNRVWIRIQDLLPKPNLEP